MNEAEKVEEKKQKIGYQKRKEILALNSQVPQNIEKYKELHKLYKKANQLEKKKQLQKAIELYEKIIDIDEYFKKAWEGLGRIYSFKGESEKRDSVLDRIKIISEIIDFETNACQKIRLHQLKLYNLEFYTDFTWTFQPQINILLGKNGYGKSYLMRLIVSLLQADDNISSDYFYGRKTNSFIKLILERNKQELLIHRTKTVFKESIGKVPLLAIPDLRFLDKSRTSIGTLEDEKTDLREYGAYHFLYNKPYESIIRKFLYELCIKFMDGGKSFQLPIFKLLHSVVQELADKEFKFHQINAIGNARFEIKVITEGNQDNPLPLQYASQGTLSVLTIFGLIYEYLSAVHQCKNMPENQCMKKPGIVFIDELDAHLHPDWQQKIIRLLRENFPNIQFIVTAQSPMVVAGCFEGEAAVLRSEPNGFGVESLNRDLIGWEAAELLRKIFEVEDKDHNYLYYTAMAPFKNEILDYITSFEHKRKENELSEEEETTLKKLYKDLEYVEKVSEKNRKRQRYDDLLMECRKLKAENKKLRNK
jgi:predicted ATPase